MRTAAPFAFHSSERIALPRVAVITGVVVLITALALGVRLSGLSTYGFSEDEINKVRAIEQYRQGRLDANAEHPMLMKLAMWASVDAAAAWNRVAPPDDAIAIETAIRLPNAIVGAATAAALFGVCQTAFGAPVGMMAAMLWAVDVNATAVNRIGKEDTFALFFFLLAVWSYERAKQRGVRDPDSAQRWYAGSGVAFGLMLASKYFPQYLGVYAFFNEVTDRRPGENRPRRLLYYGAMAAAFLVANVAALNPATWRYCLDYLHGGTVVHHGYPFAGRLYGNTSLLSPGGIPPTFYLRLLATKVPVVVLGALVPGFIESIRRRRERGFVLLHLWLGLFLVGYSLTSVKFLRYALPLFAAIDILAAIGVVAGVRWLLRKSWLPPLARVAVAGAALFVSMAGPSLAQWTAAPYYSIFRNAIGERVAAAGATFPEETYDYGVREAVAAIGGVARPGAAIVSDAPAAVAYYVEHGSRPDLRVQSLSRSGIRTGDGQVFVIVQDEHVTFENRDTIARLERTRAPWRVFYAGDAVAARVFCIPRSRS